MMEQILAPENLQRAWHRVRTNAGAPGVDGMTVAAFPAFCRERWPAIRSALMSGTYRPAPVRRVFIPKPDGSQRPLGGPLSPLLANITLDPLDKEIERRGHRFARYADDVLVMVKSAKAVERVLASLTRFVEGRLKRAVNRVKSKAAPLKTCAFLGFQIGARGRAVWSAKAHARFKRRVREITRRNRGHRVRDVIDELRRYVVGWLNYFSLIDTYSALMELDEWLRRRVRLYYPPSRRRYGGTGWKQWKQPRTRRRHLIALGISPDEVHRATRSRKGYWRMSANSIVQPVCHAGHGTGRRALTNRWLHEQGVPDMRTLWITLHYGPMARL